MANTERMEAFMKADFLPAREHAPVPPTDARIATALEYIAYHIGQIDKKLDSISMSLAHAAQRR